MSLGLIASRRVVVLSFHISVRVVELLLVRPQVNSDADQSSFLERPSVQVIGFGKVFVYHVS